MPSDDQRRTRKPSSAGGQPSVEPPPPARRLEEILRLTRDAADEARTSATLAATSATLSRWWIAPTVIVLALAILAVVAIVFSDSTKLTVGGLIAILSAVVAIALVVIGIGGMAGRQATAPTLTPRNYLEREIDERATRRATLAALSIVIIGVLLLGTTMVVSGAKATSEGESDAKTEESTKPPSSGAAGSTDPSGPGHGHGHGCGCGRGDDEGN